VRVVVDRGPQVRESCEGHTSQSAPQGWYAQAERTWPNPSAGQHQPDHGRPLTAAHVYACIAPASGSDGTPL
jgi:hypothetical protein